MAMFIIRMGVYANDSLRLRVIYPTTLPCGDSISILAASESPRPLSAVASSCLDLRAFVSEHLHHRRFDRGLFSFQSVSGTGL
ncbi:hypothetical protein E2C01_031148 [Portunus trituberculatus]|uniref:Uncharacterized protein n=1 Tax=Portunus trituberculatus TaxID=210409 RepID=A0A5B7ESR8_PORTR|nr:hypothetical protein [Portunus trituberculatus]